MRDDTIEKQILIAVQDCSFYRKVRFSNSGGFCAWINPDIQHQRMKEMEFSNDEHHKESLIFEFIIKKENSIRLVYKKRLRTNKFVDKQNCPCL